LRRDLVVGRWKFPQRLYATICNPDKSVGILPSATRRLGNSGRKNFEVPDWILNSTCVNGNKKDNFWMMGETGPCGPCSELHIGPDSIGRHARGACEPGTARMHRDLESGSSSSSTRIRTVPFRRSRRSMWTPGWASSAWPRSSRGRKGFTDFANAKISNYETDILRPIFDEIERFSGKTYGIRSLPAAGSTGGASRNISTSRFASLPAATSGP